MTVTVAIVDGAIPFTGLGGRTEDVVRDDLVASSSIAQNNLNRANHSRTHSHPLLLIGLSGQQGSEFPVPASYISSGGSSSSTSQFQPLQPSFTTQLTEALNLDFVNIPPNSPFHHTIDGLSNDQSLSLLPSTSSQPLKREAMSSTVEPTLPGAIPASAMEKYLADDSSSPAKEISDMLVDLELQLPSPSSSSHASEVAKVLDSFNTLLEQIQINDDQQLETPSKFVTPSNSSGTSQPSPSKIKSSVEAFAELLLRGEAGEEDEDFLIVVDVEPEKVQKEAPEGDEADADDEEEGVEGEAEEAEDSLCPLEEGDQEGYESDRPMVRASMRKLKPIKVKLKPVVESNVEQSIDATTTNVTLMGQVDHPQGVVTITTPIVLPMAVNNVPSSSSSSSELMSSLAIPVSSSSGEGSTPSNDVHPPPPPPALETNFSARVVVQITPTTSSEVHPSTEIAGSSSHTSDAANNATNCSSGSNSSEDSSQTDTSSQPQPQQSSSSNAAPTVETTATTTPSTTRNPTRATSNVARRRVPVGRWPHRLSSVLALIGCTLGLNNICRFGLLSVNYGANFVVQWFILSILFGIPLLSFHMSIGQYLNSGIVDMWKISPIFQGIGVGLLFSQAIVGLYSTVGVSWMLIYFRDSFITRGDQYRWGKCVREFRDCDPYQLHNSTEHGDLVDTVPDYFNAVVLQRDTPGIPPSLYVPNSLKFTVAFNLAVVWMLIFVSLSKGLKSYGKVVHGFVLAPVVTMFVLTFKMVGVVENTATLFGQTAWIDFFFNTTTWIVAAREVFFTWGLLGACVMQVTSHNRHSHPLKSDTMIVVLVTTVVLLLAAFVGNCCLSIIATATPTSATNLLQRYSYTPSSFEYDHSYKFLTVNGKTPSQEETLYAAPLSSHSHNSLLMGVRIAQPDHRAEGDPLTKRSGYQVLRFAVELFPTAMAVLSPTGLSPFWTVLFYFTLVLFGLAQQLAIWHTVIKGIISIQHKVLKSWETTITFVVCAMGFALGLPLCTETGIFVTYFLDFAIGSGWWIMMLYLLELVAVFIVRGAPYCGENIVTVLISGPGRIARVFAPLVSFIWNVVMPVAILVLSITSFKSTNARELYDWNSSRGYIFWPSWMREIGSLLQLLPILAVPFVAIVQSCRYLTNGPSDLFERMQQLYRPSTRLRFGSANSESERERSSSRNGGRSEDPPPKYTPPPSYSTATGAKIARFLRNSIRRSMRRMTNNTNMPSTSSANLPPPPNYASVILEINAQRCSMASSIGIPPPEYSEATGAANVGLISVTTNAEVVLSPKPKTPLSQTLSSNLLMRNVGGGKDRSSVRRISSEISSRDIARMLSLRAQNESNNNPGPSSNVMGAAGFTNQQHSTVVSVPPYTFSRDSLEKIDYDLDFLEQLERESPLSRGMNNNERGSSRSFDLLSYNRSRNRNSNDSQLALISDGFLYDIEGAHSQNSHVEVDIDMRLGATVGGVHGRSRPFPTSSSTFSEA